MPSGIADQGQGGGPEGATPHAAVSPWGGKGDLLMRFFESDFFDAWIAVT
jgi:hypothetical protein